jgi:hypothetical protein
MVAAISTMRMERTSAALVSPVGRAPIVEMSTIPARSRSVLIPTLPVILAVECSTNAQQKATIPTTALATTTGSAPPL